MNPKLIFITSSKKELELIQKHIDHKLESKLNPKALHPPSKKSLEEHYNSKEFKDFSKEIKEAWKPSEEEYFQIIQQITNHKWNLEKYNCYLTKYITGFADIPSKSDIAISQYLYKDKKFSKLSTSKLIYIISHELFHLHYMEIARENGNMNWLKLKPMELTPIFVLYDNPKTEKFHSTFPLEKALNSYKLQKSYKALLPKWKKRKSFLDFMNEITKE